MTLRIEQVTTSGVFSLDGEDHQVDNNIWLVGDDQQVIVVDAAHDAGPIVDAVGGREVVAIVCTHGHNDHINAAVALAETTGGPIALHPADRMLWDEIHPDRAPDIDLVDGMTLTVGGAGVQVLHTPGHSPGGVCLYLAEADVVFSGDTLFNGGPGATGRSYSDLDSIVASIRARLLTLPHDTVVHTGHGPSTTIGAEVANIPE
ncbi:MAG: MBL fold metallo-hydrolase [Acidimicrobiia bacterium]|nr:MBL fold metallo-hydrolase [Acidimicrobiia bacterium]